MPAVLHYICAAGRESTPLLLRIVISPATMPPPVRAAPYRLPLCHGANLLQRRKR